MDFQSCKAKTDFTREDAVLQSELMIFISFVITIARFQARLKSFDDHRQQQPLTVNTCVKLSQDNVKK